MVAVAAAVRIMPVIELPSQSSDSPGQLRIPVPVDGVLYEVIVAKPGEAKLIPTSKEASK